MNRHLDVFEALQSACDTDVGGAISSTAGNLQPCPDIGGQSTPGNILDVFLASKEYFSFSISTVVREEWSILGRCNRVALVSHTQTLEETVGHHFRTAKVPLESLLGLTDIPKITAV